MMTGTSAQLSPSAKVQDHDAPATAVMYRSALSAEGKIHRKAAGAKVGPELAK